MSNKPISDTVPATDLSPSQSYEPPAIVYEGHITTRAGSPIGFSGFDTESLLFDEEEDS